MREILFRGKRIDNGEWVYGSLLIQSGEWLSKDEKAPDEWQIFGKRGEQYLVDPKTVGQFTGLTDKNGKKIFEGDIIVINKFEKGKTKKFRVEFDDGIFGIRLSANAYDSTIIPLRSFDYIEIIKGEEND